MIWRGLPGIAGHEISDTGLVRRNVLGRNGRRPGLLAPWVAKKTGYLMVSVRTGGRRKHIAIHRAMLEAFVGPPPSRRHYAAHWDDVRLNNRLGNLRWATPGDNQRDSIRNGTKPLGEDVNTCKLDVTRVIAIRAAIAAGAAQRGVAAQFGIHQAQVHRIAARKSWSWVPEMRP